jgi:hypothetical protein
VKRSWVEISDPINENVTEEFKSTKARVDVVSDMAFSEGKLIVTGLSNEEFSSTVRIYPSCTSRAAHWHDAWIDAVVCD